MQRIQEEAKAKETKQKGQIERMRKQIEDLTERNAELQDELRAMEQMRI